MRWKSGRRSQHVEDVRRQTSRRGGFGFPMPSGAGKKKSGCSLPMIVMLLVVAYMMGFNPLSLLTGGSAGSNGGITIPSPSEISDGDFSYPGASSENTTGTVASKDEIADFISAVKGYNEDIWSEILPGKYRPAKLKIFSKYVNSGCGPAKSAMGPFYCPADQRIYIDPTFFQELRSRHSAPGDFAQAYVIAHEVGHHIQTLLGISKQVRQMQARYPKDKNQWSIRQELNADCLAGVWARRAHQKFNILEEGDLEEAINAASAIGDDRLQKKIQGFAVPHTFTHGSSKQRMRWLKTGFQSGQTTSCDTFNTKSL